MPDLEEEQNGFGIVQLPAKSVQCGVQMVQKKCLTELWNTNHIRSVHTVSVNFYDDLSRSACKTTFSLHNQYEQLISNFSCVLSIMCFCKR